MRAVTGQGGPGPPKGEAAPGSLAEVGAAGREAEQGLARARKVNPKAPIQVTLRP